MKLWLISQDDNNDWDTYDAAVVAAETEEEARLINPDGKWSNTGYDAWCKSPDLVRVHLIGEAAAGIAHGVILASFNAG